MNRVEVTSAFLCSICVCGAMLESVSVFEERTESVALPILKSAAWLGGAYIAVISRHHAKTLTNYALSMGYETFAHTKIGIDAVWSVAKELGVGIYTGRRAQ